MVDDKPKLTKAEREAKSAARVAKMLERCADAVGLPCPFTGPKACKRGCRRNAIARGISSSRKARNVAKADVLATGIAKNLAERASAEKARLDAIRFEERGRKGHDRKVELFKVRTLLLCGWSTREASKRLYHSDQRRGEIARIGKASGIEAIKGTPAGVTALTELDASAPQGYAGYVEAQAAKGLIKGLHAEFVRVRGIVPELVIEKQATWQGTRYVNVGTSALQSAAKGGSIREWNVQTGLMLAAHFARMQGNSVGAIDYSKDIVDGGGNPDAGLGSIMASQRFRRAKQAVLDAFQIEGTALIRWAIIDHVVLRDQPLATFPLSKEMGVSKALFLNDALEEVSLAFNTAPAGVRGRSPSAEMRAAHEMLGEAVMAHRTVKLERESEA